MIDPAPDPPVELLKAAGEGLTKAEIERGARTIAEEHGVSWDRLSGQYGAMEREQYRAEACAVMVEDRAGLMAADGHAACAGAVGLWVAMRTWRRRGAVSDAS